MELVTSYAEVWIEIHAISAWNIIEQVTSYAEVWIEISTLEIISPSDPSHLLRGGVD